MYYTVKVELLQQARLEKGLTQKELAGMADLSLIVINKAEMGKSIPRPKSIKKICDALELNVADVCSIHAQPSLKAIKNTGGLQCGKFASIQK